MDLDQAAWEDIVERIAEYFLRGETMPEDADDQCRIILGKVPDGEEAATALFLSGCFSLPPSSTRGIVASVPIALLSDIPAARAEAVLAELRPSLPQGVDLRIAAGTDEEQVSRLQWPRPPRIYGRDLAEFAAPPASHDLHCPVCGGLIHVYMENGAVRASVAGQRKRSSTRHIGGIKPENDKDPLFSGIKPLDTADSGRVARSALEAGDTGFWMYGSREDDGEPPQQPASRPEVRKSGETSYAKKATGKTSAGLASFMKPGVFAVVIGRTRDPQAVKMIAEIMGVDEDEAQNRCLNLGLCVARDISLDEAQNLAARFRNLGGKARIVKPM